MSGTSMPSWSIPLAMPIVAGIVAVQGFAWLRLAESAPPLALATLLVFMMTVLLSLGILLAGSARHG